MEGVKTEGTAERDCWRSKQSQMMRGAKRYGGVGSQIMFCRVSMRSYRMSLVTQTRQWVEDADDDSDDFQVPAVSEGIEIYEINGPLFFASSLDFLKTIRHVSKKIKVQIIYFQNTSVIDATGLHYLRLIHQECRAADIHLILAGLHTQPLKVLKRSGCFELFRRKNIYIKLVSAIARAEELVKTEIKTAGSPA